MRNAKIKHRPANSWQGFSLLELLVVISLLGVVAMAATTLIIDTGEEKRKDATEKNWDAIRKAIVGDTTQSLNGSPYLSGYVADMGRLPNNIAELITRTPDVDMDGDESSDVFLPEQPVWFEIDLNTVAGASGTGVSGTLYGGWRGPYLYAAGSERFRDGWANKSQNANGAANETQFIPEALAIPVADRLNDGGVIIIEDALNFGWNVSHSATLVSGDYHCGDLHCEDMVVQSLGQGNLFADIPNSNDSLDYSRNFPKTLNTKIVSKNEWMVNININFDVLFNKPCTIPPTCPVNLQLRLFNFEDDGVEDSAVIPTNYPYESVNEIDIGLSLTTTAINSIGTGSVSGSDLPLPIGRYAAIVVCSNSPTQDYLYDGNCDNLTIPTQPYYFLVMPSTTKVTIPWNIP